jgi:NAD(P)-dependent dehydrogenase (short-subunit alcohol dehydrogenase family)
VLLEGKNAIIYGGGGSIGGAAARAFAREGAASDRARPVTAAIINVSAGALVD